MIVNSDIIENHILHERSLKKQCREIVEKFEKCNSELREYRRILLECAGLDNLKGEAYDAAKQKLEDYAYITNIVAANNLRVVLDCTEIISLLGDDNLNGSQILEKIEKIKTRIHEMYVEIGEAKQHLEGMSSLNPMLLYYQSKLDYNRFAVDIEEQLLEKWQAKEEHMELVMRYTDNLFGNVPYFDEAINKACQAVKADVGVKQDFIGPKNKDWREELREFASTYFRFTYSMKAEVNAFTKFEIYDEIGGEKIDGYWGGHKDWFASHFNGNSNQTIDGDALCALMNFYHSVPAYCRGVSKDEYIKNTEKFIEDSKSFNKHMQQSEENVKPNNGTQKDVQSYLNKIAKECGYHNAKWETTREISYDKIRSQLDHNIPVLLSIGDGSAKTPHLNVYKSENQIDWFGKLEKVSDINLSDSVVMITATYPNCDEESGEFRSLLRIVYEGNVYCISYEDLCDYKESYLNEVSEKQAKESYKNGYNNISVVS